MVQIVLTVVIPAFNEEGRIAPTLRLLFSWSKRMKLAFNVIVVCDGTDATANIARTFSSSFGKRLDVLECSKRLGKGGALLFGISKTKGPAFAFDADSSIDYRSFATVVKSLSKADVVIGSRRVAGAKIRGQRPLYRGFLSFFFNSITRIFFSLRYADTQCGYKLFSQKAIRKLCEYPFLSKGYEWDVEMLAAAQKLGLGVFECPVSWQQKPGGKAHFSDLIGMLCGLAMLKLRYLF